MGLQNLLGSGQEPAQWEAQSQPQIFVTFTPQSLVQLNCVLSSLSVFLLSHLSVPFCLGIMITDIFFADAFLGDVPLHPAGWPAAGAEVPAEDSLMRHPRNFSTKCLLFYSCHHLYRKFAVSENCEAP